MKVDGNVTMIGAQAAVYATLNDPEVLRQCLPDCEKFDEVAPGRYETIMKAGVAGMRGTFAGTVTLSDATPPDAYTLTVEGTFSGGFARSGGGGSTGTALDPAAALQGQLTLDEPIDLLRLNASVPDPGYLRVVALEAYDAAEGWTIGNLDGESDVAD